MQTPTQHQTLPPVFLQEGQKLEVFESRTFWGQKKMTYRVVPVKNNNGYVVLGMIILTFVVSIVIYHYKSVEKTVNETSTKVSVIKKR